MLCYFCFQPSTLKPSSNRYRPPWRRDAVETSSNSWVSSSVFCDSKLLLSEAEGLGLRASGLGFRVHRGFGFRIYGVLLAVHFTADSASVPMREVLRPLCSDLLLTGKEMITN